MKTYTCTTCNENFVGKGSYNQHLVSDAHRASREQTEKEKMAAEAWKVAKRIAVKNSERWIVGSEDRVHQYLAYENANLASDVEQLKKEVKYFADRITRDIAVRVEQRGAAAIYSGSSFQNTHEVPNLEGRIYGRSQTLISLASALGYRCEATFEPREWKFYEMLAAVAVEKTVVGSFKLTSAGTFEEFEFKSEAAAVAAAVEFVQLQMKQQEVA